MKEINRFINHISFVLLAVLLMSICVFPVSAYAANSFSLDAELFQSNVDDKHSTTNGLKVDMLSFGKQGIGRLTLNGSITEESLINGIRAFSSNQAIVIGYQYDGAYLDDSKEQTWFLESDSGKTISDFSLLKIIGKGALVIQKSTNGIYWNNAIEPITDFFSDSKIDREKLYEVSEDELKSGTYFRILIAYEMKHKTGTKDGWWFFPDSNIYEDVYFTEVYKFYGCYESDPIVFRDIIKQNTEISSGESVPYGFIIDKKGSGNKVEIQKDSDEWKTVDTLTTVTEAGNYSIKVTTSLGKEFYYSISITDGLSVTTLKPSVFENKKRDKYTEDNPVHGKTSFNVSSHTSLTIAQNSKAPIVASKVKGFDAYGVKGEGVYLFLRIKNNLKDWNIVNDEWGSRSSQKIYGVHTGRVDSGALIVQTSTDGEKWEDVDKARYLNGLYTTDFENHYGNKGDVLLYLPSGNDIINGVFVRVVYAYEIANTSSKADQRCIEKYAFYLCSDNLEAVTFHNLTVDENSNELFGEYDENTVEVYRSAETMLSGDYTVNGFSIDTGRNPTVTFKVKRNGETYVVPNDLKVIESGKYEIELKSAVGSTKNITLFVDRMSKDEALQYYFGEPLFLNGKRIYSEGSYPVYEGGNETKYILPEVDDNHLPLSGYIENKHTGERIEISPSREAKEGNLFASGIDENGDFFEAVFSTKEEGFTSGDCRRFTFRFILIPEGKAPGPKVNEEELEKYSHKDISDSYPVFYAVTYPSADPKGDITSAFASREKAFEFALNFESRAVEKQPDGTFRYKGNLQVAQKEKYDSAWELADAKRYFAEQAVHIGYFDLSDRFTVVTLDTSDDSQIKEVDNWRTLELANSVVLFAVDEKEKLTDLDAYPFINDKPYYHLNPVRDGEITSGYNQFRFVRDNNHYDSDSVLITDRNGKQYVIRYKDEYKEESENKSVGQQLSEQNCPSGIVTITEKTVYGDETSYKAVYIADGDNTAAITIGTYDGNGEKSETLNKKDNGREIRCKAFRIIGIDDPLDPYCLLLVEHNGEKAYVADQVINSIWTEEGKYRIKLVNRLGFYYEFWIIITDSDYVSINFTGEGTDSIQSILTTCGAQHVELPQLNRDGYHFVGFEDEAGTRYSNEIVSVDFMGDKTLNAIWANKKYTVTLKNAVGETINVFEMSVGEECSLPSPAIPQGQQFTGWMLNGELVESDTYTLATENDVTLIATTVPVSNNEELSDDNDDMVGSLQTHKILIIISTLLIICLSAFMLVKGRNKW